MDEITPFDLERMVWGSLPALFYLEIVLRILIIWLWTVLLLRWVGGRSISQMSVVEFLLVIALGAAVGDPMFQPDVPLFHAMLAILVVVLCDKAVHVALRRWTGAKRLVDGTPTEIMRDGHLRKAGLDHEGLGPSEVMELLRLQGIRNLGQVERAYLEPSGDLSVFCCDRPRPGLSIMPPLELRGLSAPGDGEACCIACGLLRDDHNAACPECGEMRVTRAETAKARAA